MQPAIAPLIIGDVWSVLHQKDQVYFRETREAALGRPLEAVMADRDTRVATFRQTIEPLRTVLGAQPFIAGDAPGYADYIPFGGLQWARCTSPFQLLATDDPVHAWRERMLDLFDGLARKTLAF